MIFLCLSGNIISMASSSNVVEEAQIEVRNKLCEKHFRMSFEEFLLQTNDVTIKKLTEKVEEFVNLINNSEKKERAFTSKHFDSEDILRIKTIGRARLNIESVIDKSKEFINSFLRDSQIKSYYSNIADLEGGDDRYLRSIVTKLEELVANLDDSFHYTTQNNS